MSSGIVTGMSLADKAETIDCESCVLSKQSKSRAKGSLVNLEMDVLCTRILTGRLRRRL